MCVVRILHNPQRLVLLWVHCCGGVVFVCLVISGAVVLLIDIFVSVVPAGSGWAVSAMTLLPHLLDRCLLACILLVHELLILGHFSLLLHHEFAVARLTPYNLAIRAPYA